MAKRSLTGAKFVLVTAAAVLGFGVAASFVIPSANASQGTPTSTVAVAPTAVAEVPSTEAPSTEAPSTDTPGTDCVNGLDSTGAQCDGGPAANPNDKSTDIQGDSERQNESSISTDADNIQSQN